MKTSPLLFLLPISFCLLLAPVAEAQVDTKEMMTEAQKAYMKGDLDTAKIKFAQIVEIEPRNVLAQNYLSMITQREKGEVKNRVLENQLKSLVLPKVEMKEMTFTTALEYLKQQATKESDGKVAVNFVVMVPADVSSKPVSLSLTNVPFTEVMRYLGEMTGSEFVIEKYAIKVRMPAAAAAPVVDSSSATTPSPAPAPQTGM